MTSTRIWIMDGHNMIFAISSLQQLQVSDRREEAREALADRLERFALARSEKVLIVFDGNELASNPDAIRRPMLEVVYARRGVTEADDRIIYEARSCLKQGRPVTVVTNDISTLAGELPRGVDHLRVQAFWLKYIDKPVGEGGKRVEGDFSDVERDMLAQAAVVESGPPAPGSQPGRGVAPSSGAGMKGRPAEEESPHDRLRRKRERGRLRQERRLKGRSKPARRR